MKNVLTDITKVSEFTRGVARFARIASNAMTGVEAWRRSYFREPWRDTIEFIIPQGGKYYPEEKNIMRRILANDKQFKEKVDFYLSNGLDKFFPGDEPHGFWDDEEETENQ